MIKIEALPPSRPDFYPSFVAYAGKNVEVGRLEVYADDSYWYIHRIGVHRDFRNQGISRSLIQKWREVNRIGPGIPIFVPVTNEATLDYLVQHYSPQLRNGGIMITDPTILGQIEIVRVLIASQIQIDCLQAFEDHGVVQSFLQGQTR